MYLMDFKNDVKGHGFFRKHGKKLVSAIALAGAVVLFGGVVSADEVANSTSSVDNTTTKVTPVNGTEAVEVSKNPTYTTSVPVSKDLVDSVSEAKNSGLTVNETETKSVESVKKGQEDYTKQSEAIDKTVDDYNKQVADYNKATNVESEGKGESQSVTDAGQLYFKLKNTNEKPVFPAVSWHKDTYEQPLTVKKEVTDKDGKDVNHQTVKLGDVVKYPLTGSLVDVSAKPLYRYGFTDYLDTVHDEYQGYMAELTDKANVTLKTGEKVTDEMLRQNVTVSYDGKTGKWDFDVNKDFLSKLSSSSKFQVKAVISALRVKAGDSIKNDVFHYVNDDVIYFGSVETKTPENPKPVTPVKDETVTPVVPVVEKAPVVEKQVVLPQTGEKSTVLALVSGIVLFVFGMFGLKQSKNN